jgi:hypothetical protein
METLLQSRREVDVSTCADPIIVATDGLPQSRGAIATAGAIAKELQSDIGVIAVHPSLALLVPDGLGRLAISMQRHGLPVSPGNHHTGDRSA